MGDARCRHQVEQAFEQAVAGAQHRGEDQFLALQVGASIVSSGVSIVVVVSSRSRVTS